MKFIMATIDKNLGLQIMEAVILTARQVLRHGSHVSDKHVLRHLSMPGGMHDADRIKVFQAGLKDHFVEGKIPILSDIDALLHCTDPDDFESRLIHLLNAGDAYFAEVYKKEFGDIQNLKSTQR